MTWLIYRQQQRLLALAEWDAVNRYLAENARLRRRDN